MASLHTTLRILLCFVLASNVQAGFFFQLKQDKCYNDIVSFGCWNRQRASADCSKFVQTTISPFDSTIYETVVATETLTTDLPTITDSAKESSPTGATIPAYAAGCKSSSAYASACSCLGIHAATITAPPKIVTATITIPSPASSETV
ncbi:hypothetical protein TWF694_006245 [Orbilia ellipsospora]|uniref:Uncharacterized protein n=1 Tax=Orbilia ellipsospora TaxID=2528407 RepID=A0AAV9XJI1_9PEZI